MTLTTLHSAMAWRVVLCALALAAAAPDKHRDSVSYDTIVVGLGSAGVTAASTLARAGRRVLGLEAQDRVGGRVHTVPFGDGLVELGAEWIHGTENSRSYDLAIANNISLRDTPTEMKVYRSDGSPYDADLIGELIDFCLGVTDNPPEPPMPVGNYTTTKLMEYLTQHKPELLKDQDFITQFLEFMNLIVNSYESSNNWNDVTTSSDYEELGGSQVMSWHRYGYKTFFELMLNTYNNGTGLANLDIKLNTEVTHIAVPQQPSDKVVVTCKDGSTYEADAVIVTVSLGVLKAKHSSLFSTPLPQNKVTAIEKMSIGVVDKIVLAFEEPWWPLDDVSFYGFIWKGEDRKKVTKEDFWTTMIYGISRPMASSNTLSLWLSGDVGKHVETLPEDVVQSKSQQLLQKFVGDGMNLTVPKPIGLKRTTWFSNPFTRGSYSFDNLLAPEYPEARAWLGSPLVDGSGAPRVLFAGEATNLRHFSTVHGASETGYREAKRLLAGST